MRPILPAHHVPCPACATHQRPALRALAPCPARASALPCLRQHPALPVPAPCTDRPSAVLPCLAAASTALHAAQRPTALPCPARQSAALPYCQTCPARPPALCARATCALLPCPACTANCRYRLRTLLQLLPLLLLPLLPLHLPVQESLSPQQLHEWAIWWGSPGGGASCACRRKPLSPQQHREWAVRWGATTGGTCDSSPAGNAASRRGGSGGVQQQQQRPLETLFPQHLCEWAVRWGSPGGGGFWGTRTWGVEAPGGVEATSLRACQVAASVEVASSCSCRLLTHQTLLWHHRLGHPSRPHLRGMHSRLLVSGLPRSLPPLPRSIALPCLPCVEGRQRAAPHSSSFPPTTAPLQTLHMDVWGPARVTGQGGERYFLMVVDDYTHYTTVFLLQSKADVCAVCLQLRARFGSDLLVLRLQSNRGAEFCFRLLEAFLRRIGLVMEVARTSMIDAAAPHFLWPFAVQYAAEQLNLCPRVSHPETSPTLRWTGDVGDLSEFWVWGSLSLVCDLHAGKLFPRTLRCVFLGFPTNAPPWQFYHPGSRRVLSSRDVTFDESVSFYHLHPHHSSLLDPPPLVEPLEVSSDTFGPAEGGDQTATDIVAPRRSSRLAVPPGFPPRPSSPSLRPVAVDSGAAGGGDTGGVDSGGAASPTGAGGAAARVSADGGAGGAGTGGAGAGGAGTGGAGAGGAGARRQGTLSPEWLRKWAVRWGSPGGGAAGAAGSGDAGPGGASAGVLGVGHARGIGTGGTGTIRGTGGAAAVGAAAGSPGSRLQESLLPKRLREWAVHWGSPGGGAGRAGAAGSRGAGLGGASAGVPGVGHAGGMSTGDTGTTRGTGGAVGAALAACSGGAGPGGANAGVLGVGRARGTGTGGTGATGGTGGAGPIGASAVVPRVGGTGGADTGGATGGTEVGGASRQESLSPQQLRAWAVGWGILGGGAGGAGSGGAVPTGARGSGGVTTQPQPSALRHLLSLPPADTEFPIAGTTPPILFPQTGQSQPQLLLGSPLTAPAPHTEVTASLTARREPENRASTPEHRELETSVPARVRRVRRPRAPAIPSTHDMTLRPSSVPYRVVLPSPPTSSLPHVLDPESDLLRAASLTVTCLLATVVTDPSFESAVASALVAELVDFAALCHLDYAASLVFDSSCPPSVGGELALGCDVLEDRKFGLECLAAAAPHLASTLLCPEGDPDAMDIPTPRTYAEAITGPYSSQWQIAMDAEMASWKSTGTYVDEIPPPVANIVDGMWIFRVKRPPGSPPAFKAHYVAQEFSQHQKMHWEAAKRVLCYLCGTSDMGLVLGGQGSVVLTSHSDASWADDQTTHRSTQGYIFSLGTSSVSWRSTRSSSVLSSSCEAEIYAGAMAAQELRWLTYLLTDLGERPRSPPVLYVDNKAMIALCPVQRLEHRTEHIALRYFLTQELQQLCQLRLAYVVTQANTADVFTKALGSSDH
ncbi:unnamed protein product [Closterium sp. NIES-54]